MMGIAVSNQPVNHCIHRVETCGAVVERFGQFPFVLKKIGYSFFLTLHEADRPHELPPPDDLPDETLQRIEWNRVFFCSAKFVLPPFQLDSPQMA
jgi:hypothetical protein